MQINKIKGSRIELKLVKKSIYLKLHAGSCDYEN